MMNELIDAVSAKTGLSQDQAKSAVDAVLALLRSRLPAPLASGLDRLTGTEASTGDESGAQPAGEDLASEASSVLGSLFGSKS